jgi:chromosome segregation ATPase
MFYPRELIYYAVLYHEGAVWRVLKAGDIDAAEPAFRHFVEQAMRLADAEMRRAHLEAQNEQFSRLIAESEAQIERVRVDLHRGGEQDQEVALKQQEVRKALAQLDGRRVAAQTQLNKLQRQRHQLDATINESVPHLPPIR